MTRGAEANRGSRLTLIVGGAVLLLLLGLVYGLNWHNTLSQTEGHFTYGLDDPYIHLAISKNLASHGIWGVTAHGFSSASSSPLWTALLALTIKIAGHHDIIPFILGVIASVAAALICYSKFKQTGFYVVLAVISAFAVFMVGPLQLLPFTGMEHCLQILLDVMFACWVLDLFNSPVTLKQVKFAALITMLMCACRYESAFLIVIPFCVSLWRKEWKLATAFAIGPLVAIGGFGLYSTVVGMPFVPNSIILKGKTPSFLPEVIVRAIGFLCNGTPAVWDLFVLTVGAGLLLRLKGLRETTLSLQIWIWTVVSATCMHAGLAVIGIYYRYEAYLVVLLAMALILAIDRILKFVWEGSEMEVPTLHWLLAILVGVVLQFGLTAILWTYRLTSHVSMASDVLVGALLAAMLLAPKTQRNLMRVFVGATFLIGTVMTIIDRSQTAHMEMPLASRDIYLQQVQMGRFIDRYYHDGKLAANDIGAVSYFSNVHLLDLVGLASDEIRILRRAHNFSTDTVGVQLAKFDPDVIIVYKEWFKGNEALPASMVLVSEWTIPQNTTAAGRTIRLYAPNLEKAKVLRANIEDFKKSLPSRVDVLMVDLPE